MELALRNDRSSLPTGVGVSVLVHLAAIAYIAISFSHPQPLAPPVDLAHAIPINMDIFRPTPPPPEPPKEKPKPQTPKNVVSTQAKQPDVEVQKPAEEPTPPAPAPQEQPSTGEPATATYASLVAGILQRNKKYPREALINEITGTVVAYFVVNHQGHVLAYRIEESSGKPVLDSEVVRLLKYSHFPPIPDDGGDPERREFKIPLTFTIAG